MRRILIPLAILLLSATCAIPIAGATEVGSRRVERSGAATYRRSAQSQSQPRSAASPATAPSLAGNIPIIRPAPLDEGNIQNEPFVAVDPTNAKHIVAGANDYRNGSGGQAGWSVTTNGGTTWTDGTFDGPDVMPTSPDVDSAGDPSIAFKYDGSRVYYGMLAFRADAFGGGGLGACEGDSGIYVGHSTNGGTGWTVVNAAPNGAAVFNDKPMLATHPTDGTIYVTYTKFIYNTASDCQNDLTPSSTPVMIRSSTDGVTWSAEVDVGGANFPDSHGSQPAISPAGTVFVAFESFSLGCGDANPHDCIVVAKSTNGGSSFSRTVARDIPVTGSYSDLPDATGSFRANNFPSIAVAPNGRVMVVWPEMGTSSEVMYSTSADGASSWSAAARVHLVSTGDQFFPWITFDKDGVAWVGYLDRRDDPANNLYREYVSHAHIGTSAPPYSWSDAKVSSAPSDPSITHNFATGPGPEEHFIGDYTGIAPLPGGGAFAAWIDARSNGDQNIYGDTANLVALLGNHNDTELLWKYVGYWQLNTASYYSSGTRHYTNSPSAYAEIVVKGGSWRYVATKGPNYGIAEVYVDGILYTRPDLYSPTLVQQTPAIEKPIIGTHTVRIKMSGYKNVNSSGYGISVDTLYVGPNGVGPGVYQDTHATAWGYTGSWTVQSSPSYSGGARHYSNSRLSQATIVVTGSRVEFRATKGPNWGILNIFMDGVRIVSVNLYQPSTQNGRTILLRSLSGGYHVFRLEVAGARDSRSTSGQVNFDACVVT